ncbi:hypothetical protein T492DRAFT_445867 [Pavlovales sp. CCMP2436]|nr:hypothetical protein T492DRAFT_445867 [Pavlovales sp. CCMP2436]|mmetsp:Transcript_8530/g.19917  ORF Transcript_8530/g.19917 Transcript_8530/m.19917 type:complete len:216 (+) Transcript_8530:199-846(+)
MMLRIRLLRGCIVQHALADRARPAALVTSANPHLSGEASPSYWQFAGRNSADGAIRLAAGPLLEAELQQIHGRPLTPGSAIATSAGLLEAEMLVHAIAPDRLYGAAPGSGTNPLAQLRSCYESALQLADEAGMQSITFPPIGCGVRGWPPALSAKAAIQAFEERAPSLRSLRVCEIVSLEMHTHKTWASVLREHVKSRRDSLLGFDPEDDEPRIT